VVKGVFSAEIDTANFGNSIYLASSVRVGALNSVTAVPEPETWAMMFVGLFGVGFVGRRRQS
jgi:hypothetical protein